MTQKTTIHVLRHGEVCNPLGILYGRLPGYRLSPLGVTQANMVSTTLLEHDIAYVIASPLLRAQQTASPIAQSHGLSITTNDRLIEAGSVFEGTSFGVGDGVLRHPRQWHQLWNPFKPSWGEPYIDIAYRMLGALYDAQRLAEGREAVLVSHQLPIWVLRLFMQGKRLWHDPRRRQCGVASLTSFIFDGPTFVEMTYSELAGTTKNTSVGA